MISLPHTFIVPTLIAVHLFHLSTRCKDWLLVCKEKKENELRQRKWQFPLVWLPWLFALVDSFTFVVGFGFDGVNESWFCGAFVSVNSPHRAWRNGMLVAVAGTVNILIISTMGVLIKVSFVTCCENSNDRLIFFSNSAEMRFFYLK